MQPESLVDLPIIGATCASRIAELVYRHLRRELRTDEDMNEEVREIMERKYFGNPGQRNGKNILGTGNSNTLFDNIDKTYNTLREKEDQMYLQRISDITFRDKRDEGPRDRETIIKSLKAALNDLLQEAEQSLRERTSSRTYGPVT